MTGVKKRHAPALPGWWKLLTQRWWNPLFWGSVIVLFVAEVLNGAWKGVRAFGDDLRDFFTRYRV